MSEDNGILANITGQMKDAMRSGDSQRRDVLRMLMAEIQNAELAGGKKSATEAVASYGKRLAKGIEEMKAVGAADRAEVMVVELKIVSEFLPAQLTACELEQLIAQILTAGDFGPKDVGLVMRELMKSHKDQIDGKLASHLVRKKLLG